MFSVHKVEPIQVSIHGMLITLKTFQHSQRGIYIASFPGSPPRAHAGESLGTRLVYTHVVYTTRQISIASLCSMSLQQCMWSKCIRMQFQYVPTPTCTPTKFTDNYLYKQLGAGFSKQLYICPQRGTYLVQVH